MADEIVSYATLHAIAPDSGAIAGICFAPDGTLFFARPEMTLSARVAAAEASLYYSLFGLTEHAERLAGEAEQIGDNFNAVRARMVAADARSRLGQLEVAKSEQLSLRQQAAPWPALRRRAGVLLTSTFERRGERTESIKTIRDACALWPDDDHPEWRAEALMIFSLFSIVGHSVDYSLARLAIAAVREHCSPLLQSATFANFAEVAAECGDLSMAAEFAAEATVILTRHPEVTAPLTLDSIARAHIALGEIDTAIELLHRALDIEESLGCSDVQGDPWLTTAEALLARGDFNAALAVLDHPRRTRMAAASAWTRSRDLKQRAVILARLERWQEAFLALSGHLEIYEVLRSVDSDRFTAENETRQVADEERRRAQRFEKLSMTDALTGLPNRRQVDEWLSKPGPELHLAIVDLDHFKRINDTYSHAVGDLVLQRVAETLQSTMFALADKVGGARAGRLGGEEFIVVWTGINEAVVTAHAHHLLDRIRELRFDDIDPNLVMTISIGLAFCRAGLSASQQLSKADERLYIAKSAGRDRVVFDSSESDFAQVQRAG